jgi:hypothetical protein
MKYYQDYDKKLKKIEHDSTKHYPNKNEAELLRKIMAENKLTEEEVRSIKKYRKMLASASKMGVKAKRSKVEKYYQDLIKKACKQTGLARQHPLTIHVLDELLKHEFSSIMWRPWFISSTDNASAASLVKRYPNKE